MQRRPFGDTGLHVSIVGLGGGPLGDAALSEAEAEALVLGALDLGIDLIDTAPSYGASEARLGRILRGRRDRVTLSTKLGYGVDGVPDWTGPCITGGVERALRVLATDRIDVAHLHSCGPEVLAREDIARALEDAVRAGKVRVAAYSGDGPGLRAAARMAVFRAFQASVNLVDQAALAEPLPAGAGLLGKRALLNAAFVGAAPGRADVEEYARRWAALAPGLPRAVTDDAAAAATRFAAFAGPHAILVGTRRLDRLRAAVAAAEDGPLAPAVVAAIRGAWATFGWPGMI